MFQHINICRYCTYLVCANLSIPTNRKILLITDRGNPCNSKLTGSALLAYMNLKMGFESKNWLTQLWRHKFA